MITLSRSHIVPFLTFSERRDLREQAWRAWTSRGEHDGASDNRGVAARDPAAAPRAGAPARLRELRRLRAQRHDGAQPGGGDVAARAGVAAGAARAPRTSARRSRRWRSRAARAARSSRGTGASTPRRCARCATTSTRPTIKPYFPLDRMVDAAFDCAARLFGVSFVARADIVAYHPDVRVYEVHGADGARSASSCTTTSPARPSAAAPG